MYICIYIYVYIYIYIHTHTQTQTRKHTYTHAHAHLKSRRCPYSEILCISRRLHTRVTQILNIRHLARSRLQILKYSRCTRYRRIVFVYMYHCIKTFCLPMKIALRVLESIVQIITLVCVCMCMHVGMHVVEDVYVPLYEDVLFAYEDCFSGSGIDCAD